MLQITVQLIGGIGMFLLGMGLMTDSLKAMAGESLRQWLGRFTGSPFTAMLSGTGFTLIVQSSTATTLATIGFVSAGVLSFAQAIGVIIGANIGTTGTGWLVALLGLKFSIAKIALPMVGVGAMMKLLGKNALALSGLALAGFGLLFIGIDILQTAMAGFAEAVDLAQFSNDSLVSQLILVVIGIVMTVLLQSSSAAITATLAALAGGAIDLNQALALVIGQNVGTVATAMLASIGATVSAKRTAAVHVVFNVITAVAAFVLLKPAMVWAIDAGWLQGWDNVLIIALFHTLFSVMGALIFMPLIAQFQALLKRMIPDTGTDNTRFLDESLFSMPAVATFAAKEALCASLAGVYRQLIAQAQSRSDVPVDTRDLDSCLVKVDQFLQKMPVPQADSDQEQLMGLFQLVVYTRVIRDDLLQDKYIQVLRDGLKNDTRQTGELAQVTSLFDSLAMWLEKLPSDGLPPPFVAQFVAMGDAMKAQKTDVRQNIITQSAQTDEHHAADAFDLIVARRWLDRLVKHSAKMVILLAAK